MELEYPIDNLITLWKLTPLKEKCQTKQNWEQSKSALKCPMFKGNC